MQATSAPQFHSLFESKKSFLDYDTLITSTENPHKYVTAFITQGPGRDLSLSELSSKAVSVTIINRSQGQLLADFIEHLSASIIVYDQDLHPKHQSNPIYSTPNE